jgi:hypothetical protein
VGAGPISVIHVTFIVENFLVGVSMRVGKVAKVNLVKEGLILVNESFVVATDFVGSVKNVGRVLGECFSYALEYFTFKSSLELTRIF